MEYIHRFTVEGETYDVPHSELGAFRKKAPEATEVEFFRRGGDDFAVPVSERAAFEAELQGQPAERVYRYRDGKNEFAVPESEVQPFLTEKRGQATGVGPGGGIAWDGDMPFGLKVLEAVGRTASGLASGAWGGLSGLIRVEGAGSDLVRRAFGATEEDLRAKPGMANWIANGIDEALEKTTGEITGEVGGDNPFNNPEVLVDPRWWYNGIGNAVGTLALMVATGGATMAAAVGGAMAAGQSYGRQKEQGGSTLASAARATAVGFAIAALERVGLNRIFGEGGASKALNVLKTTLAEGGEEFLENPVTALVENLGMVAPTEYGARVLEALKSGFGDAIFGGVLGGGIEVLKPAGRKGGTEGQEQEQAPEDTSGPVQAEAGTSVPAGGEAGTSGPAGGEAGLARTVADLDAALAEEAAGPVVQPQQVVQPPPLPVMPEVAQAGREGQEQAQEGTVQQEQAQGEVAGQEPAPVPEPVASAKPPEQAKPPELMTPEEWAKDFDARGLSQVDRQSSQWKGGRVNHAYQVQDAIDAKRPVNAEAFEKYSASPTSPDWKLKRTTGYVREGDRYVFKGEQTAAKTPEIAKAFAAEQPAGKGKKAKGKAAQGGTVGQEQAQAAMGKGQKAGPKVAPAEPTYVVAYKYTPKQIAKLSFAKMREAAKKNKYKDGSSVWDRVPGKNKLKDDVRVELIRHRKMYMEAEGKQEKKEWTREAAQGKLGFLDQAQADVDAQIAKLKAEGRMGAGPDPELAALLVAKGAIKIARGVRDFAAWSAEMIREFGESVRPQLQAIWEESKRQAARMHGTAARVAAAPLGQSVPGRPGSYYAPVSFEEAAEQARQLSTQDLMSQAERLGNEQKKFESDMGVIAGAEAFNRLHAAVVQAAKSGDAEARARAVAERDAWLDTMNKMGMTAARLLGQFRYLKAGMPGAQIAIVERELREKGLTLREEDRRALEAAIVEDTQAQRALAGAQAAQARSPSAAGAAAVTMAQGRAVMALRKLWQAQRVLPRELADEIVFAMQMNVMTPQSSGGNILGNIMFLGPELVAREHAAVIDRFVSFLGGKARTVRGVSAREIKEVGRTLAGSGPALRSILARGDTGRIQNMAGQRGEWRPLIAWSDMMAGRMVRVMQANGQAGRVPVSQFLSRALEGTSGMAAAPMARSLKVGDYLFSRPAEAAALVEIGELQGLQGAALEAFVQNPPADAVKAAKEQGLWTTFQQGGGPAAGVSFALNNLKKKGVHGKVAYVGVRAAIPFVKTPLNILGRVLRYTPGVGMWSVFEAAREGNVREVRLGLARQLVGAEVLTAVGLMAMLGVLFGIPDDEKKRAVAQATTGTGKANISGLRRAMARMAAGNWTLDDLREAAAWRKDDEMMGFNYMGIPGLFASMAANTQLAVEAGRNSADPWRRDRGALASWIAEAGLNVPNAMIELSMMKGAYTALDAFAKKQPKRFVANMVSTLASVALPRTLETEQDAAWTWAPETKGKTIGEEVSAALAQRIPGRMYGELPVKRDYFGRPVRNVPEGVNPWLAKNFDVLQGGKVRGNDVDRELADIYNATGDAEAWPSIPERVYIRKDGTEVVMTPAEWSKHLRNVGAARYGLVQEAMRMQQWGKMRPDEKLAVLGRIYGTGRKIGTFMSDQQRDTGSIPWSQIPKSIQQAWQAAATD